MFEDIVSVSPCEAVLVGRVLEKPSSGIRDGSSSWMKREWIAGARGSEKIICSFVGKIILFG